MQNLISDICIIALMLGALFAILTMCLAVYYPHQNVGKLWLCMIKGYPIDTKGVTKRKAARKTSRKQLTNKKAA